MSKARRVFWVLSIIMMIMIFVFSSEDAIKSGRGSGRVCRFIVEHFNPDYPSMTEADIKVEIERISYYVRKTAHFLEYFTLGFLLLNAVDKGLLRPFAIGGAYSVTDEIHQYFVPGRACMIQDVMIDCFGVMCGCIAMYIIRYFFMKIRRL